jgi:outer membrane protein TolC
MIEPQMHLSCIFRVVGAVVLVATIAGCAVGPNFHPVAAPEVRNYTPERLPTHTASAGVIGGASQILQPGAEVPGQWWSLFHSAQLDQLIDEALKANPNLAAAQAALREAQENVSAEQGYLYPSVGAGVSGIRERRLFYKTGVPKGISSPFNLLNTGVNVSYTLDVFGGIRRQVEAYKAQAEYQQFELEAAYLMLTADVVTTAIQEASLRGQIAATFKLINDERDQLKIVQNEFELGGASEADAAAVEQAIGNRARSAQASHRPLSQRGYWRELRPLGTPIAAKLAAEPAIATHRAAARRSPIPGAPACSERRGRCGHGKYAAAVHD